MKDDTSVYVRWLFTVVGLAIAGYALMSKEFGYALPFLIIAMIPWCDFESLTLLGSGIKFGKQLEKAEKSVKSAKIQEPKAKPQKSIISVPVDLTMVMIQRKQKIEDQLRQLFRKYNFNIVYGEVLTTAGYTDRLEQTGVLDQKEVAAIVEAIALFNRSVHGYRFPQDDVLRAIKVGDAISTLLDKKLAL